MTIPSGIVSAKVKQIHARSTLVMHGNSKVWDPNGRGIELYWREGGLIYILSSDTVSQEELIKIAQSIE